MFPTEPFCEPLRLVVVLDGDGAGVEEDQHDHEPEPGGRLREREQGQNKGRGQLKKNVFFRALPELPKSPPMTPIRATWFSFFGSRNSRFESQFRTKNTIYTI